MLRFLTKINRNIKKIGLQSHPSQVCLPGLHVVDCGRLLLLFEQARMYAGLQVTGASGCALCGLCGGNFLCLAVRARACVRVRV